MASSESATTLTLERIRAVMAAFDASTPWRRIAFQSSFLPSAWVPDGQMYVLDLRQSMLGDNGYRVVGSQTAIDFVCAMPEWQGMSRNEIAACIVWNQLRLWEQDTQRIPRPFTEDEMRSGILKDAQPIIRTDIA